MYNILEFSEIAEYNYNYGTKFIKYNYNRSIYYYLDDNKPDTIGKDEYGNRAIISLRPLIIFEE